MSCREKRTIQEQDRLSLLRTQGELLKLREDFEKLCKKVDKLLEEHERNGPYSIK